MKLVRQQIEQKDGSGSATLMPEEPEDMVSNPSSTIPIGELLILCSGMHTI
jgi:hypothetical protein